MAKKVILAAHWAQFGHFGIYGSVMAAFVGVEHGFRVVSLFVSKIVAKMTILSARSAKFGHFGI